MAVVLDSIRDANNWFWNPKFWLPHNVTWEDIKSTNETRYVEFSDLLTPLPVAIFIIVTRVIYERTIATWVGQLFDLKDVKKRPAPANPQLEAAYRKSAKPNHTTVVGLSKQLDLSARQIERWFRQRRNQDRPSILRKFTESFWKFSYYLSAFIYGLAILWDKPWFWDTTYCWLDFPFQPLSSEVYWYYMIEMGFYLSLTFSQFLDVKRKDFWQMFVHHICTLLLLGFSWSGNMIRVGTLVLVIHDAVDYWMEAAKMAKYCRLDKLCDLMFIIFTVVWFITRLVIFPVRVLYFALTVAHVLLNMSVFSAYIVYNALLVVLQILHIIWFVMIMAIAVKAVRFGKVGLWRRILRTVMFEAHVIIGEFKSRMLFLALLFLLQILHLVWFYMICKIAYVATVAGQVQKDDRSSSDEELSSGEPEENQNIKKIATSHNDIDGKLNSKPKQTNNHLR